jgi:hypothetical protein
MSLKRPDFFWRNTTLYTELRLHLRSPLFHNQERNQEQDYASNKEEVSFYRFYFSATSADLKYENRFVI